MALEHDFNRFPELTNAQLNTELKYLSPHKQIEEDFFAKVVKVQDGDTLTLLTSFRNFTFPLRIAEVDADELSEGGAEARDWLNNRILNEEVMIIVNRNNRVGKYGRLIGKVMHRGIDVAEEMLALGLTHRFGFKNEGQPEPLDKIFRLVQWGL